MINAIVVILLYDNLDNFPTKTIQMVNNVIR